MYSHFIKGLTVGQVFLSRILRNITGLPGLIPDVFFATFYPDGFEKYWEEATIAYGDGVKTSFFRGLLGWIGEIAGYIIGGLGGGLIGAALYIPDLMLRGISSGINYIFNQLNDFASIVGRYSRFNDFSPFQAPDNYLEKAWNISVGSSGLLLGSILYGVARLIELCLPMIGRHLSHASWVVGGMAGEALVWQFLFLYTLSNILLRH